MLEKLESVCGEKAIDFVDPLVSVWAARLAEKWIIPRQMFIARVRPAEGNAW